MDTVADAREIIANLTRGVPQFKDWRITVDWRELEPGESEDFVSARVDFDEDVRRAKIWIDVRYPDPRETYTLEEIVAHELGHIVCGEDCNSERAATRAGLLLVAWARERANCKCGAQSAE